MLKSELIRDAMENSPLIPSLFYCSTVYICQFPHISALFTIIPDLILLPLCNNGGSPAQHLFESPTNQRYSAGPGSQEEGWAIQDFMSYLQNMKAEDVYPVFDKPGEWKGLHEDRKSSKKGQILIETGKTKKGYEARVRVGRIWDAGVACVFG